MTILKIIGIIVLVLLAIPVIAFIALVFYTLVSLGHEYYKSGQETNCILTAILIVSTLNLIKGK